MWQEHNDKDNNYNICSATFSNVLDAVKIHDDNDEYNVSGLWWYLWKSLNIIT